MDRISLHFQKISKLKFPYCDDIKEVGEEAFGWLLDHQVEPSWMRLMPLYKRLQRDLKTSLPHENTVGRL